MVNLHGCQALLGGSLGSPSLLLSKIGGCVALSQLVCGSIYSSVGKVLVQTGYEVFTTTFKSRFFSRARARVCVHVYVCELKWTYHTYFIQVCFHTCMYIYIYIHIYTCIYIYATKKYMKTLRNVLWLITVVYFLSIWFLYGDYIKSDDSEVIPFAFNIPSGSSILSPLRWGVP